MRKFSVPLHYIVWVDVEAHDEYEAREVADAVPVTICADAEDKPLEVEYNDMGEVYEYPTDETRSFGNR